MADSLNIPLIDCGGTERKHRVAEEYPATHTVEYGVFLILVANPPASVWGVSRSASGAITNLAEKTSYVNHYSFHAWIHSGVTSRSRCPGIRPFGAQIILNGHEYVACQARAAKIGFTKEGNCFTAVTDSQALAQVADTLSQQATVGRLSQVCDRWIYSACLCFGVDSEEQSRSGFHYSYSIYQVEYSSNLLFRVGGQLDRVFNTLVDRTRSRLDVPTLRTLFGARKRPRRNTAPDLSPRQAVVIETPRWDLTTFKLHFVLLTLKAYTKGKHVLRLEAIVHNTKRLGCRRMIEKFPEIVSRLAGMTERFCTVLDCVDVGYVPDGPLDELPQPILDRRQPRRSY